MGQYLLYLINLREREAVSGSMRQYLLNLINLREFVSGSMMQYLLKLINLRNIWFVWEYGAPGEK